MTTTATGFVKPERIYEPLQFELDDAPEDVKAYSLLMAVSGGELITNDTLMGALTLGFNLLPRAAPTPGDRVRITELLTDEVRHCYMNDHLARALGGDPSKIDFFAPDLQQFVPFPMVDQLARDLDLPPDEATLPIPGMENVGRAFFGEAGLLGLAKSFDEMSLWTAYAVLNMCIDRAAGMLIKETVNSSFAPLARMNRGIASDEAGHAQTGYHHLRDMLETKEGRERAQSALDVIWPLSLDFFQLFPENRYGEELLRLGIIERTGPELEQDYLDLMVLLFEGLDLCVPAAA